jgi:hypothetical protein
MKIYPVGAELFHMDREAVRRTNMTKLIVALRNFANAPKKPLVYICHPIISCSRYEFLTFFCFNKKKLNVSFHQIWITTA